MKLLRILIRLMKVVRALRRKSVDLNQFGVMTWSWQPVCDFAAIFRPIILAFAALTALFIISGTGGRASATT